MTSGSSVGTDAQSRLDYLAHSLDLLWPDAGRLDTPDRVVLPSLSTPRLLVPAGARRAAAAAVLRYTAQQGLRDRAKAVALAVAVGAGLGRRLPVQIPAHPSDAESVDAHLAAVLGRPVTTVLALTRDRPNRKPVLQVFDARGRSLAWVKIGTSALSDELVDAEARSLRALAAEGLSHSVVPAVLHHGRWRGHPVLVLGDLGRGAQVAADDAALIAAMGELAGTGRGTYGEYLAGLRTRAARAGQTDTEWGRCFEAVVAAGVEPAVGAWHGDWTPWNCAGRRGHLLLWDLERFTAPAPLGFDVLHYRLNVQIDRARDRFPAAAATLVTDAPRLLIPFGSGADAARTTVLLYLLDLALRYVSDGLPATDPAGDVERWAYPTVRAALAASTLGGPPR